MRGAFDDRRAEPAEARRDTELTLSATTLLGIFVGLVLLCGLCFGLGYALGHRGGAEASAATQPDVTSQTSQAGSTLAKPSAGPPSAAQPAPADAAGAPGTADAAAGDATATGTTPGQPAAVRPALPGAADAPQASSGTPGTVAAGPSLLMVQIAAVTNPEDADVLVNALRRHGYAVNAERDGVDGLIHVRIGPFRSRDEANAWRQRLLSDGYNAIVQP